MKYKEDEFPCITCNTCSFDLSVLTPEEIDERFVEYGTTQYNLKTKTFRFSPITSYKNFLSEEKLSQPKILAKFGALINRITNGYEAFFSKTNNLLFTAHPVHSYL